MRAGGRRSLSSFTRPTYDLSWEVRIRSVLKPMSTNESPYSTLKIYFMTNVKDTFNALTGVALYIMYLREG
jgi:hypothetical protein